MSDNEITTETEADTEGHMPRVKWIEPAGAEDDAEGHGRRWPAPTNVAADGSDTEGHGIRGKGGLQPAGTEGEDTEGHAAKFRP